MLMQAQYRWACQKRTSIFACAFESTSKGKTNLHLPPTRSLAGNASSNPYQASRSAKLTGGTDKNQLNKQRLNAEEAH